jgi:beta-lactamase superfamily II metal-dependent hydrolase
MAIKYVGKFKTVLTDDRGGRHPLIWGDPCQVLEPVAGGTIKVRARGIPGQVKTADLSDESLLEIYVIDVGQGDGILLKTPEGKWHLIDAGVKNEEQMTRKGAPNFIRWKFRKDLGMDRAPLENVIVSHSDFDHYGGMINLLGEDLGDPSDNWGPVPVDVQNLYHCGIARYKTKPPLGARAEGEVGPMPDEHRGIKRKGSFLTELLDGKGTFENPPHPFTDGFAEFAAQVAAKPKKVKRLSQEDRFLPGYGEGENGVVIRVLGPILERFAGGKKGLRVLGSDPVTVNGHSIVLRLDYGQARLLLTGDLNEKSQKLLLSYRPEGDFAADVVKACHHGSEDIDIDFIKTLQARATVISSGDNEDYAHPRPLVMGASARYGREARGEDGATIPPLVYSTELARSVKLDYASMVRVDIDPGPGVDEKTVVAADAEVKPTPEKARFLPLARTPLSTDLVYGLVNVRTDGRHVLCATMEEKGSDFDVKVFEAGVTP